MSWANALDETVWICAVMDYKIVDAFRLVNISSAPRNCFEYSKKELQETREKIKSLGYKTSFMGHSHPSKSHLRQPSKNDWQYLPKNSIQLIAFPDEQQIGIFKNSKEYGRAVKSFVIICFK